MAENSSTEGIDSILFGFSHPAPGPDDSVIELITIKCAELYLSRVLEAKSRSVAEQSTGLYDVLGEWLPRRKSPLWDPLLGRLRALSAEEDSSSEYHLTLIRAGLAALLDGVAGTWGFRFSSPMRIQFGRWLLPEVISGRIEAAGGVKVSLVLEDQEGSKHRLILEQRSAGRNWEPLRLSPEIVNLPCVKFKESETVLLPANAVDEWLLPNLPGARFEDVSRLPLVADRFRQTAALVERYSPGYAQWIDRAVRYIASTNSPKQGSGSNVGYPGLVVMSNDHRPWALAEMLVHEASHQYFFMATLLGPVDDGSDLTHHYSPLVGRNRPIDKVLLSYHALGNMTLFFRDCISGGIEDGGYCLERLTTVTNQMAQVSEVLRDTSALTSVGKALWSPLADRVVACAL
jgi:HEXXH motif-containing protein